MMKLRPSAVLLTIDAASLLLVVFIGVIPVTALQVALGIPFCIFYPGYCLMAACFPKKGVFDSIEKLVLSVGTSLAIIAFIAMLLNYTPWKIDLEPLLLSILLFVLVTSGIARFRLGRLDEEPGTGVKIDLKPFARLGRGDKWTVGLVAFSVVLLLAVLGYTATQPKIWKPFTEFYVLSLDREPRGFTTNFILAQNRLAVSTPERKSGSVTIDPGPDEQGKVLLSIVNQERRETAYRLSVRIDGKEARFWVDGREVTELAPIDVADNATWEKEIGYLPPKVPGRYRIEFVLFKGAEEYRQLHFDLNVA